MLTSKQRAILRAQANGLDVVFQVGKGEIDDALVESTADCLAARELIKMKVLENSAYSAKDSCFFQFFLNGQYFLVLGKCRIVFHVGILS